MNYYLNTWITRFFSLPPPPPHLHLLFSIRNPWKMSISFNVTISVELNSINVLLAPLHLNEVRERARFAKKLLKAFVVVIIAVDRRCRFKSICAKREEKSSNNNSRLCTNTIPSCSSCIALEPLSFSLSIFCVYVNARLFRLKTLSAIFLLFYRKLIALFFCVFHVAGTYATHNSHLFNIEAKYIDICEMRRK